MFHAVLATVNVYRSASGGDVARWHGTRDAKPLDIVWL